MFLNEGKQEHRLSPIAQWLLQYVEEHDISLTELARKSGLSDGALRALVRYPERKPTIETCLRLAPSTNREAEEIIELAELQTLKGSKQLHPDRFELINIFDVASYPIKLAILDVARALSKVENQKNGRGI